MGSNNKILSGQGKDSASDKSKSGNSPLSYRLAKLARTVSLLKSDFKQIEIIVNSMTTAVTQNYLFVDQYNEVESDNIFTTLQGAQNRAEEIASTFPDQQILIMVLNIPTDSQLVINKAGTYFYLFIRNAFERIDINMDSSVTDDINLRLFNISYLQYGSISDGVYINRSGGNSESVNIACESMDIEAIEDDPGTFLGTSISVNHSLIRSVNNPQGFATFNNYSLFGNSGTNNKAWYMTLRENCQWGGDSFDFGDGFIPPSIFDVAVGTVKEIKANNPYNLYMDSISLHKLYTQNAPLILTNVTLNRQGANENDFIETFDNKAGFPANGYYNGRVLVDASTGILWTWDGSKYINSSPISIVTPAPPNPVGDFNGQLGVTFGTNPPVLYIYDSAGGAWIPV